MTGEREAVRLAALRLAGRPLTVVGRLAGRAAGPPPRSERGDGPRILLIRPDHLGDVLLATPAAAVLRDAVPGARIDWLVGPWSAEMARRAGGPADVLTLDFPGFTRRPKRSAVGPYRLLLRAANRLRAGHYDAALILRPDHWWGAMLAAAAGIPGRFGFSVAECRPFLTDTLPPPDGHAVVANQQLARLAALLLGGTVADDRAFLAPRFPIADEDAAWAASHATPAGGGSGRPCGRPPGRSSPANHAALERDGSGPLVAIHPGSGAAVKGWLSERWADVARTLAATHGARVILTGGPAERTLVDEIAARLDPVPQTLVGATSLGQLAALFARCALVVGADSGPLHLAAAVGTPTVRLYGPTDIREFGPWPPEGPHVALAAGLACQPCRDLAAPLCGARRGSPPCLRAVDIETVVAAATRLLREPDPSSQRDPASTGPR